MLVDAQLVPAHAPASARRVHRVHCDDGLVVPDPAIHEARHDLVTLRVEPPIDPGLRHAVRELAVAQVVVWRDRNPRGACDLRSRRVLPIDAERPDVEARVLHHLLQPVSYTHLTLPTSDLV